MTMQSNIVKKIYSSANEYPDKTALVDGDRVLTYRELAQQINAAASYLINNGVVKSDRVSIILENSVEYVIAYYAILAAGGVVVALNTQAKAEDLQNWIVHSGSKLIFLNSMNRESGDLLNRISDNYNIVEVSSCRVVDNSHSIVSWNDILHEKVTDDNHAVVVSNEDLASIIYTSGTTGKPKGVMLSHGNLDANFTSIIDYLSLTSQDSIVNVLPFYYSYGNSILHTHLFAGASVVLENSFMYPKKTLEKLVEHKVTGFSGVPSTFGILLNRTKLEEYDLSSLRYITQAGGPMPVANIERIRAVLPETELIIMYGQTEATARLSYLPSSALEQKMGSVGIPIPGVKFEIRDDDGNKVSDGVVGEVYASGKNIMCGYWRADDITNLTIINGWLKTGDLGRIDEQGYLFLTGRKSDMIKVGGHRISPVEIEEKIIELDGVEEVVAVGNDDDLLGQVIHVYVVHSNSNDINERDVRAHCSQHMASYKVPKTVRFVDKLPRTASGKIQRYLLKKI